MEPPSPQDDVANRPERASPRRRGWWGAGTLVVLVVWALPVHPWLDGEAVWGETGTTFSTSTTTSSETQTTSETVRVDTFATRVVATDPIGAPVSDQTLPLPFADAAVQNAIATAQAALLAGPPVSLVVKGPALVDTAVTLVGSSSMTVETGRDNTETLTVDNDLGPTCIGIGNRDLPNATPCASCAFASAVPARGEPLCVVAGTQNFNANADTHTVIHELQTTTDTYLTTERYTLRGSFLDHFVLYKVKPTKGTPKLAAFGPVTLADALGGADYDVKKLPALGLPADKNAEGRADATTHLAQYALKRRKGAPKFAKIPNVAIANQCGALVLTLTKPESLLVPVAQDLATPPPTLDPLSHEVDHLLCYKAKAQKKRTDGDGTPVTTLAKGVQVDAVDDFQTRRYDLKKVTRLCVPVATSGTPATLKTGTAIPFIPTALRHPAGHLVCYQAKLAKKTIPQNGCGPVDPKNKGTKIVPKPPKHRKRIAVQINGPLGAATLDTTKEIELCIPSIATLP